MAEAVAHVAFAAHSAHQACLKDASFGILQIDVSNAFNTLSRHEILSNVRSKFPKLQRWAHWCLGNAGTLLTGVETIASTTGVQQVDPLGPFFFAAGIQRIIVGLQQKFKRCLQLWYLDDGVIAIRFEVLELLLRELGASFQDIGLILNTTNRKLFTIGDPSKFDELSRIPETTDRLEVLGTPLGNEDFVDKSLNAKFSKAHAFCDAVVAVDDPQTCLALLKLCAGTCHILHLLKVVPPSR